MDLRDGKNLSKRIKEHSVSNNLIEEISKSQFANDIAIF